MYRTMLLIRRYEERLVEAYLEGKAPRFDISAGPVPGEMHLAAGQEPVAVGVIAHLRREDTVTGPHRPHHLAIHTHAEHEPRLGWMPSPASAMTPVPPEEYTIPFGKADIKRPGKDVTIVTLGLMVHRALEAATALENQGISAEVIDLRTLVPLDREAVLTSVRKTGRLLVVDEDYRSFGLTGEIAALVAENDPRMLKVPFRRLAVPDVPIPYSRPLENFVLVSSEHVSDAARALVA